MRTEAAPARLFPRAAIRPLEAQFRRGLTAVLKHAFLISFALLFVAPWFWMLSTSLKPLRQAFLVPPVWIPQPIEWQNYPRAFLAAPLLMYTQNTLTIALISVVGALLSNTLVAYSFARLRWPGRDLCFIAVIATLMLPFQVTMIPLYILFRQFGWLNTFLPLIVPTFLGSAFYTFLLRQFFLTIPQEISDAARIDGCSEFGVLWRIILPMSKPGLAVVALFQFINAWNDFLAPLIYLDEKSKFTLALGLRNMQTAYGTSDIPVIMAATTMTILPVIVVFFIAQRTFIQGITFSGLKG